MLSKECGLMSMSDKNAAKRMEPGLVIRQLSGSDSVEELAKLVNRAYSALDTTNFKLESAQHDFHGILTR